MTVAVLHKYLVRENAGATVQVPDSNGPCTSVDMVVIKEAIIGLSDLSGHVGEFAWKTIDPVFEVCVNGMTPVHQVEAIIFLILEIAPKIANSSHDQR